MSIQNIELDNLSTEVYKPPFRLEYHGWLAGILAVAFCFGTTYVFASALVKLL